MAIPSWFARHMRILLVATDVQVPGNHGGSTHVSELFAGLSKRADTLLLARHDSEGARVVPLGKPLRHHKKVLRQLDSAALFPRAWREVRSFRPDVIYERCSSYGLGALLSVAFDAPLLTMVLDERFSWLSLLRADKLVASRLDMIPRAVRAKGELVHWGANVERFAADLDYEAARAAAGFSAGDFVIGYSGSFKRWHGLSALVEVADRWRDPKVRFLMVGDGPCRPEIEAALGERGLVDRFVFTGSLPYEQVPGRLVAADVCVAPFDPTEHTPSRERGSFVLDPLKVFEYLAQQKPAVTIRADNLLNIFRDGEHLRLYAPGDVDELLRCLRWVYDHGDEAAQMAWRGRELVLAKYTWQAHADHLYRLFERMLAGG